MFSHISNKKINLKGNPLEEKNPDYNIDASEVVVCMT